MTSFFGRQPVVKKSFKVLSVTMDFTQLQEVGALGTILFESLRQSKSAGSNLSRAGKNITVHIQDGAAYEGA